MTEGEALRRLGAVGFKLKLVYTFDLGRNASIGAFRAAAQMSSIFVSSLLGKSSWGLAHINISGKTVRLTGSESYRTKTFDISCCRDDHRLVRQDPA